MCFWSNRGHCGLRREKLVWKAPWVWPETLKKQVWWPKRPENVKILENKGCGILGYTYMNIIGLILEGLGVQREAFARPLEVFRDALGVP